MPKVKRILVATCFEVAQRRRRCWRNRGHEIRPGDKCLVVTESMRKRNYCMGCAAVILAKARAELDGLFVEKETWQAVSARPGSAAQ